MITVTIPSWEQAAWIEDAILSVPDDPRVFLTVVDDGSTDGTFELAAEVCNSLPRASVVKGPHVGMAANWNRAVASVTTPWFTLLCGDDVLLPPWLSVVGATTFDLTASVVTQRCRSEVTNIIGPPAGPVDTTTIHNVNPVPLIGTAVRTSLWRDVGGFIDRHECYPDWSFWRCAAITGAGFVSTGEIGAETFPHRGQTARIWAEGSHERWARNTNRAVNEWEVRWRTSQMPAS